MPLLVAVLAMIFLADDERRIYFIVTSSVLAILNIAAIVLKIGLTLFAFEGIALAALLAACFMKKSDKAEASLIMTAVCAGFTFVNLVILPMIELNTFDFGMVADYYLEMVDSLREAFVETAMEAYGQILASGGIEISESIVTELYNHQLTMAISYIVIICFAVVGIAMKLFAKLYTRLCEDNSPVIYWRFRTTSVFAYFYIALMFLSIFTSTSGGVLGITIGNLYNIFLIVYAYIGFNQAVAMLSVKVRPAVAILIIVVVTVVAMSFALQLLAVLGVLYTIRKNREAIPKAE
ncbi:MAG: hypothetical protein IKU99_00415 [Clostridia bacterium]|nr:hypothetical protein [Clostridia bacterium]